MFIDKVIVYGCMYIVVSAGVAFLWLMMQVTKAVSV